MFEGLKCIELSGKKYPVKCDLVVLEKIQDEFGSIGEFEGQMIPWEPLLDEEGNVILKKGKSCIKEKSRILKR